MYGKVYSCSLLGLEATLVEVEVDFSRGIPSFNMVGLLSSEVKEARERVTTALKHSGFDLPPMKITVNLSPADLRKQGSLFDLPIAIAILIAQGVILQNAVKDVLFLGELSLDGNLRPIDGVLAMLDSIQHTNYRYCVIPRRNQAEGAILMKESFQVYTAEHLSEVIAMFQDATNASKKLPLAKPATAETKSIPQPDFSEIHGQAHLKRATEIAAAGMHNILYTGIPGSGKTMIARRIPSILPPMTIEEQITVTKLASLGGYLPKDAGLLTERPFRSPHHTASSTALVGGGSLPKPGEISYAHHGVLFLDEFPEFSRNTIELLRQPLEDGYVTISRAAGTCTFPADFMLVAAKNPCPCGYYPDRNRCNCSPLQILNYQNRISGPILDRIDLFAEAEPVTLEQLGLSVNTTNVIEESSETIRSRVLRAWHLQQKRFQNTPNLHFNAQISGQQIMDYCNPTREAKAFLEEAFARMQLSARACHRVLRVSRTIADLAEREQVETTAVAEALSYRNQEEAPQLSQGLAGNPRNK